MRKLFSTVACVVLLCGSIIISQAATPPKRTSSNEVVGLKLPPTSEVNYDEGFVTITADTKGTVKWLVLSTSAKVKFRVQPAAPNEITIAVPPFQSAITVFAIAVVDGKQTDFARTDIIVKGQAPDPTPVDPPATGPFYLSIIEDPAKRTAGTKDIVTSTQLRAKLKDKKVSMRVYSTADTKELAKYRFDTALKTHGAPLMVLQDKTGKGLIVEKLSADQSSLLKRIGPFVGGF